MENQQKQLSIQIDSQTSLEGNVTSFEDRVKIRFDQLFKTLKANVRYNKKHISDDNLIVLPVGSQHTRSIAPIFRSNDKTHWIASTNDSNPTKILKIIFPTFDGTSPKMWINKCNKYFNINQMSDEQKLYMISIHLEGRVDIWFHDY